MGPKDIYDLIAKRRVINDAARLQGGSFPHGGDIPGVSMQSSAPGFVPGMTINQAAKQSSGSVYGDIQSAFVALANGVDKLVLSRPGNTRVFLLIYNPNAANLYFAFDQQANASCLPIPPGGNLLMDVFVPQNDLHLFYTGAAVTVPIMYSNATL